MIQEELCLLVSSILPRYGRFMNRPLCINILIDESITDIKICYGGAYKEDNS